MTTLFIRLAPFWMFLLLALPLTAQANRLVTITFNPNEGAFDPTPRPPGATGRPDFIQDGVRYAGFRHEDPGTPSGTDYWIAHTHIKGYFQSPIQGWADAPHSWRDELQGGLISVEDGSKFDLISIDYSIVERYPETPAPPSRSQFERLPWSQPEDDVAIIVAPDVQIATPTFADYESQWTAYSIDDGSEFDLGGGVTDPSRPAAGTPMGTLFFSGFDNLDQIFITHTGEEVLFGKVVIRVLDGDAEVPEPGTALLLMTGLVWVGIRQARHRMTID